MKKTNVFILCAVPILILSMLLAGCSTFEDLFWKGVQGDTSGESDGSATADTADTGGGSSSDSGSGSDSGGDASRSAVFTAGPQWNNMMISQARMAFSYAFSAGGMWAGQVGYKPGEYTIFRWTMEREDSIDIERAYLKEQDDGNQWWRVSWEDSGDKWIWEALFDPDDGTMLRMRARDSDGNEGEIPVSGETIYMPAAELTRESVQGATVDKGKVTVPAGTFQADHMVFMAGGEGDVEFWLAPQIPGGVVKYQVSSQGEGVVWESELLDYGKKATTVLGVF